MPSRSKGTEKKQRPGDVPGGEGVRVDRWLWAIRLFKTRGLAAEACKGGQVTVAGKEAKPSRLIRIGDHVVVSKDGLQHQLNVTGLTEKRVGAKLVPEFCQDLTPEDERERARRTREEQRQNDVFSNLPGRPTKRDRRQWETFLKAIKP